MAARVGDVVDLAARPVVLAGRLLGGDQHLLRAQGVGDVLVFHRSGDAVADIDLALQLRAGNDRVAFGVVNHFTFEQVDATDELAHQAAGWGLVDVHWRADLGDPARCMMAMRWAMVMASS